MKLLQRLVPCSKKLSVRSACIFILHMKFSDDALVNKEGNGDAEETHNSEIPASPAEVMLKIFSSTTPILNKSVLVSFHSSAHYRSLRISPFLCLQNRSL